LTIFFGFVFFSNYDWKIFFFFEITLFSFVFSVCDVGNKCIKPDEIYIDEKDCVCQECKIRTYPPGAETLTKWIGKMQSTNVATV